MNARLASLAEFLLGLLWTYSYSIKKWQVESKSYRLCANSAGQIFNWLKFVRLSVVTHGTTIPHLCTCNCILNFKLFTFKLYRERKIFVNTGTTILYAQLFKNPISRIEIEFLAGRFKNWPAWCEHLDCLNFCTAKVWLHFGFGKVALCALKTVKTTDQS